MPASDAKVKDSALRKEYIQYIQDRIHYMAVATKQEVQ